MRLPCHEKEPIIRPIINPAESRNRGTIPITTILVVL
jgi:hypothetical protein